MIADKISDFLSDNNTTVADHLVYQIEKLAGLAFRRQFMQAQQDRSGGLSLSSCGKCPRQLAYNFLGFERIGKELDGRARMTFFQGDLVELTLMTLARLAGCNLIGTGFNQIVVKLDIDGTLVEGHPDGFLIGSDMTRLVECKSMNSYAFERFEDGEIDDSYYAQINAYLEATNLDECVMLAMNKDNGVVKENIVFRDPVLINSIKNKLSIVLKSTKDTLPPAPADLSPDAKGFYSWKCLYCNFWGTCRTGAHKVLVGKSYKLHV